MNHLGSEARGDSFAFSTIYLLQHFTLDVVMGIMMGVFLIFIVEKGKVKTPAVLLTVGNSMKSDVNYGVMSLSRVFQRSLCRLALRIYSGRLLGKIFRCVSFTAPTASS